MNTNKLGAGVEEVTVLIDTWWNVNSKCAKISINARFVLIDTWWNVNNNFRKNSQIQRAVLIDTWWNVNVTADQTLLIPFQF